MTPTEKVKNIFAFLSILFQESSECLENLINMDPDYIIEKFEQYVISTRIEYDWGLHPILRRDVFNRYCDKWKLPITENLEQCCICGSGTINKTIPCKKCQRSNTSLYGG